MRSLPELVEFIRVSCKNKNSSITKMEKDLNFANGTVGKWANGKRYPPKDKLSLVADFLQISIEELMNEEQKEKPAPGVSELDLSSLSAEDVELFKRILAAPEAKKKAIRELL
nr:MAG TPA: hypothetical protein [Caudoviricetes sp.]